MKPKCRHAKNYKGLRPPRCGCRECNEIFNMAQSKPRPEIFREAQAHLSPGDGNFYNWFCASNALGPWGANVKLRGSEVKILKAVLGDWPDEFLLRREPRLFTLVPRPGRERQAFRFDALSLAYEIARTGGL
jgi:hypothetical protein